VGTWVSTATYQVVEKTAYLVRELFTALSAFIVGGKRGAQSKQCWKEGGGANAVITVLAGTRREPGNVSILEPPLIGIEYPWLRYEHPETATEIVEAKRIELEILVRGRQSGKVPALRSRRLRDVDAWKAPGPRVRRHGREQEMLSAVDSHGN
jgi:hypothetical protein